MKERKRKIIESDFKKVGVDLSVVDINTDKGMAIIDAIDIAHKRHDIFWYMITPRDIEVTNDLTRMNTFTFFEEEIQKKLKDKSQEYLQSFKPLDQWLSEGLLDGGVATRGQKLRYISGLVETRMEIPVCRQTAVK